MGLGLQAESLGEAQGCLSVGLKRGNFLAFQALPASAASFKPVRNLAGLCLCSARMSVKLNFCVALSFFSWSGHSPKARLYRKKT